MPPILLIATLLSASLARAPDPRPDDAGERIDAFEKAFRSPPSRPKTAEERGEALALLDGLDVPAAAEALVGAFEDLEKEAAAFEERKREVDEQIAAIVRGQEFKKRTLDVKVKAAYDALCAEAAAIEKQVTALRRLEQKVLARVEALESEGAVGWLVSNVIGARKLPLSLKLHAARAAGALGFDMADPLMKALANAKSAEDLTVVLEGIGICGEPARECAPDVVEALQHEDASVREQAAFALSRIASPLGIEPLIARLEVEEGATKRRIGIALEVLTRQKLGDSAPAWRRWLENEGAGFVAGREKLGGGRSSLAEALSTPADPRKNVYYHGIPQEGRSIVYVIDCSGSMVVSAKDPQHDARGPVDAGPESRMEATKDALIEVLGQLDRQDQFNIVCFNDVVRPYAESMRAAAPGEIRKAQDWVRELGANSTTNIHDALQEAFRLAGRGASDRYYPSAVDTIFLLTDGSPTKPDSTPYSTERIHESVKRWNPTRHLVIHAIGIGKDLNVGFLQRLARENGGRFVQK